MQALVKRSVAEKAVYNIEDVADPGAPGPNDVRIAIDCIGICTSDVHVLHGAMNMPDGNIVGHEFTGRVEACGSDVDDLAIGQRVICELAKGACLVCETCTSGQYEFCPHKQPPGWSSQGIYASHTIQPRYCVHPLADTVPAAVAALAEPVAICVYGLIERARVDRDWKTVIYGMGPIGLLSVIVLRDLGMQDITVVSSTRHGRGRLELAEQLGATRCLGAEENIPEILGTQWDCVVDCSGAPSAINQGLGLLRKGGCFVALGIAGQDEIPFAFNTAVLRAINMVFSCTSSRKAWQRSVGILERNSDDIAKLVTHQLPLAKWQDAYNAIESREAIKAVLTP